MVLGLALAMLASPVAPSSADPDVFTKTRSDGVTVVCIRHEKRPSIVSSRVQCNTVAGWRAAARHSALTLRVSDPAFESSTIRGSTVLGPR